MLNLDKFMIIVQLILNLKIYIKSLIIFIMLFDPQNY